MKKGGLQQCPDVAASEDKADEKKKKKDKEDEKKKMDKEDEKKKKEDEEKKKKKEKRKKASNALNAWSHLCMLTSMHSLHCIYFSGTDSGVCGSHT